MRREELYLRDIVEASESIRAFLGGVTQETFLRNDLLQSAVLQKLMLIGDAAAHVSSTLQAKYPEVPWRRVVAFRNYAIHEYFGVNWSYAWVAATEDSPQLEEQVRAVLAAEFGA